MLIVVSPAKKLDYDTPPTIKKSTTPEFLDQSQILIDRLRQYSAIDMKFGFHRKRGIEPNCSSTISQFIDKGPFINSCHYLKRTFAFKGNFTIVYNHPRRIGQSVAYT